jgi:hypothetical protein
MSKLQGPKGHAPILVVVVLGRFSGDTSEAPVACFLRSSFFHPANCLDASARTKDETQLDQISV